MENLTDFDDDLYQTMTFQKSHLILLQIIEWQVNTDTLCLCKPRSATHDHVRFELPAFNAWDEAIVHGRSDMRCV